jgi:hypothetical protein
MEPEVQILWRQAGSHITQQQNSSLLSAKSRVRRRGSDNVGIIFVVEIPGSTAMYAGVDFGDSDQIPDSSFPDGF